MPDLSSSFSLKLGGNTYSGLEDLAYRSGISIDVLQSRIAKYGSDADKILAPVTSANSHPIKIGKKTYPNFYAAYQKLNIYPYILRQRLFSGETNVMKLTAPTNQLTINHHTFKSISDAAAHYGLQAKTLENRLKQGALTMEELVKKTNIKAHKGNHKEIIINDHTFNSIAEARRHYGVSDVTYYARLRRGMSQKDAITTPVKNKIKKHSELLINGQVFINVQNAAKVLGHAPSTLYAWRKKHPKLPQGKAIEIEYNKKHRSERTENFAAQTSYQQSQSPASISALIKKVNQSGLQILAKRIHTETFKINSASTYGDLADINQLEKIDSDREFAYLIKYPDGRQSPLMTARQLISKLQTL